MLIRKKRFSDLSIILCKHTLTKTRNGCKKSHLILNCFIQSGPGRPIYLLLVVSSRNLAVNGGGCSVTHLISLAFDIVFKRVTSAMGALQSGQQVPVDGLITSPRSD